MSNRFAFTWLTTRSAAPLPSLPRLGAIASIWTKMSHNQLHWEVACNNTSEASIIDLELAVYKLTGWDSICDPLNCLPHQKIECKGMRPEHGWIAGEQHAHFHQHTCWEVPVPVDHHQHQTFCWARECIKKNSKRTRYTFMSYNQYQRKTEIWEMWNRGSPIQRTFTEIKLAPASLAIAFATRVLPQPGGPYRRTPVAISIPNAYKSIAIATIITSMKYSPNYKA